ncbi:MAG: heme o synthase [SAR324 cluster bacterium]|nr:heme o synthase [SAR324 cluster bacterium]
MTPSGKMPIAAALSARIHDLLVLGKPRITLMVLVATAVGYLLAAALLPEWGHLGRVLLGTLLVSVGINALNQYMERDTDGLMARTSSRPLPAGRMRPRTVLASAVASSLAGVALLAYWANPLVGLIGALVVITYLLCYTPLKRQSGLNTLVGAIPGALPPVLGWAAVRGEVGLEALALFLILFMWQPPHFLAIAYLYRKDYAQAGMSMLTVLDPSGKATRRQLIVYSATLVPVSMYPTMIGMSGVIYFYGALGLALCFLAAAMGMVLWPGRVAALILLKVSVVFLLLLFGLMLFDSRIAFHDHSQGHGAASAQPAAQTTII